MPSHRLPFRILAEAEKDALRERYQLRASGGKYTCEVHLNNDGQLEGFFIIDRKGRFVPPVQEHPVRRGGKGTHRSLKTRLRRIAFQERKFQNEDRQDGRQSKR